MYSIAEKTATVGSTISRDNCRQWIKSNGKATPASNEAAQYETEEEAEEAAEAAGLDVSPSGWWTIVDTDEE